MTSTNPTGDTSFVLDDFTKFVADRAKVVKDKIAAMQKAQGEVDIGDMFATQLAMQMLTQATDLSSNVFSAVNGMMSTMARNLKQ